MAPRSDDTMGEDIFFDGARPVRWLLGQLWHCSDIMPWTLCDNLDISRGSSYKAAVQTILAERKLALRR